MCHFCGHSETKKNKVCYNCGSSHLLYSGTGTQKVESLMKNTYPSASIGRLDIDTSSKGEQLTSILKSFNKGKIDILLGTQMIAKD